MRAAIDETNRRRAIQAEFNKQHNITPKTVYKEVRDLIVATKVAEDSPKYQVRDLMKIEELKKTVIELTEKMYEYSENLEFEKAADLRDKIREIEAKIK